MLGTGIWAFFSARGQRDILRRLRPFRSLNFGFLCHCDSLSFRFVCSISSSFLLLLLLIILSSLINPAPTTHLCIHPRVTKTNSFQNPPKIYKIAAFSNFDNFHFCGSLSFLRCANLVCLWDGKSKGLGTMVDNPKNEREMRSENATGKRGDK